MKTTPVAWSMSSSSAVLAQIMNALKFHGERTYGFIVRDSAKAVDSEWSVVMA